MMKKKILWVTPFSLMLILSSCGKAAEEQPSADGPVITGSMNIVYAEQFTADYCEDGCSVVTIGDDRFLIVPEGEEVPSYSAGMTVIRQPVKNIYNAASSAMDLFDALGKLSEVTMTSTERESWTLPAVVRAMDSGDLEYIGKYSSPDYEYLSSSECGLAVESTMIYHTPAVKEQIESMGIPVIAERSSYESHPLGRMEWVKLYGLILGIPDKAEEYFEEKTAAFESMEIPDIPEEQRRTAVFFYLSPNGYVNIRKPGDYVSRMTELAGGRYLFSADELKVDDNALSTMNIQFETFYLKALDADILIYNSTIEGRLEDLGSLTAKNELIADFKAVKEGNVWCTEQNMFQQTTGAADMITDLKKIISGETDGIDELTFLYRLK